MKNFGKTTDIRDIITVGYEADNAVLYSTSQSLTNDQKIQARANIGAGTSNFDGDYKSLANKPTIPTKTSQLDNDSNFATTSQVEAKYTKPKGGIPKTDLATAVQNSLTAADSAVRYTISQSLTDGQKDQARKNIGAGTSSFSGSYDDLTNKPSIPAEVSIVQSTGESTSSVMSQKATTDAVNGRLSKTDNVNIEVLGTKKAITTLGGNQLYAPSGVIFGGTAAAAGLVTRGICGVTTPSAGGACAKENLYINYDGNNDFNAGRQVVLNAGTVGNHLGSNMYQYTVPRGEIVKNWVEAKGYATSVKVNGNTIASSGGVVDIGTVLTDASKFATSAQGTKADNAMPKSGGTFTGEVKFGSTENFQGYYIKRMLGSLGIGTRYADLDSSYKDGTWHRMWRLRFPSGSNFWGKIKITLYGGYSSFNASGVMSKSITCNFNTSNIYNNVGCYDGLGVNVEQDFRISEAIWNATASAWEVLIWQKNLNGNNSPTIMLECWTTDNTNYINAFNGITAQPVELTQSTSYSAQKASSTGGTKTVTWATLPVYENPLGEEIATVAMLEDKQDKITSSNKLSASLVSGLANVATSGSYNDLSNIPVINQDLTASGFTPVTNTYYKHTGTTTDLYTNGVIYFYNGTKYASLDGSTAVTEQVTVAADDWVLDCTTYKQVPVNPIENGDNVGVLYFDTTKTPDFSAINATISAGEVLWGNIIYNAGSSSNPYNPYLAIAVRGFPAGKTMNGTTFTSDQWGIEYYKRSPDEAVDTYFYATDELSTALGFAASGWQTERFTDMDNLCVRNTENHFSTAAGRGFFYWDEYISKDGEWKQVPVDSSTIPPFTYRASKTLGTEMNANSVVSLGYSDSASMRECASAGVAIGEVPTDSGNVISFYSVTKPTQAVNLVVEISETTTNA